MIFDTDILIWVQRGQKKAAKLINNSPKRYISIQTYMELIQCAPSKKHIKLTKDYLKNYHFIVLPLTENIGHRAAIYIEELSGSSGLRTGDAIIAATAAESELTLVTSNAKHFKNINNITTKIYKPE